MNQQKKILHYMYKRVLKNISHTLTPGILRAEGQTLLENW